MEATGWQRGRYRRERTAPTQESAVGGGKSPYRLGRDFERSIRGKLERRGWYVMRSAMSKGVVDLLAVHADHRPLMIQCKRTATIGSTEWNELFVLAAAHGCWPVVCYRTQAPAGSRQTSAFMRLDAEREPRRPGRPWTEFDPTDCSIVPVQLAAL